MSLPSNPFDVHGGRADAGSYSITVPIGPSRRYALIVQRTRFVTDGGLAKTIPVAVIAFTCHWSRRRKRVAGWSPARSVVRLLGGLAGAWVSSIEGRSAELQNGRSR